MPRYRRVNIDGQSLYKTETREAATAIKPGTAVVINTDGQFAQLPSGAPVGRVYIADVGYHQGLRITDPIPAGDSVVGNYVEEGRELAVLCYAGTYKKDTPIRNSTSGLFGVAANDYDLVIGYSQDDTVIEKGVTDFVRVRFRVGAIKDPSEAEPN